MTFSSVNYLAILIAAVAAWLVSAAWYMSLGRVWTAALGRTPEDMHAHKGSGAFMPFIYVFVADLIVAWVLAGLLVHLGALNVRGGLISAAFCWFGFILTTMVANYTFARRGLRLLLIDAGNWLIVLLVIGAILGAMGT